MSIIILKPFMEVPILNIKSGYITLMSVLVASAVLVSISLAILELGINLSKTTTTIQNTKLANSFVRSCAEEALNQVRNSSSFSGSGSLNFAGGTCSYNVFNAGGQNRLITATGTASIAIRRISINVNALTPVINILSWREVSGF